MRTQRRGAGRAPGPSQGRGLGERGTGPRVRKRGEDEIFGAEGPALRSWPLAADAGKTKALETGQVVAFLPFSFCPQSVMQASSLAEEVVIWTQTWQPRRLQQPSTGG